MMEATYYNIYTHKLYLWVKILLVFSLCVVVIPIVLGGITWLYIIWGKWRHSTSDIATGWDLGLLSSYLGGLIGIIVGFFFERGLIGQYKRLNHYKDLINVLKMELDEVYFNYNTIWKTEFDIGEKCYLKALKLNITDFSQTCDVVTGNWVEIRDKISNANKISVAKLNCKWKPQGFSWPADDKLVYMPILCDIMISIDKSAVFLQLPHGFKWDLKILLKCLLMPILIICNFFKFIKLRFWDKESKRAKYIIDSSSKLADKILHIDGTNVIFEQLNNVYRDMRYINTHNSSAYERLLVLFRYKRLIYSIEKLRFLLYNN